MTKEEVLSIVTEDDGVYDYEVVKQFFYDNFKVNNLCLCLIDDIIEKNRETEEMFKEFMITTIADNYTKVDLEHDWYVFMH